MKKVKILALLFAVLTSCTKPLTLVVSNPSLLERNGSMAEVPFAELGTTAAEAGQYAVYNEQGKPVPFQLLYNGNTGPQTLLFQVDNIRGGMQKKYTWRKGNTLTTPRVSAQYVPERKDDFAWENDLAAYRMYGPKLAAENPSNGVDLWLKCTDKPIVQQFYNDDLYNGKPYHINHGEGLDCYKVAHTLGCGGIAPYTDGKLQVGYHYLNYEIVETGALRVVFRLFYPTHTLTVTCDAGAQLNKAELTAILPQDDTKTASQWAAGIFLHDNIDNISFSEQGGWAAYAENAVSDGGEPQGRNYAAVYVPNAKEIKVEDGHLLVITDMPEDGNLTYWFGGGWSRWKYPTDADWFTATKQTALNALLPLQVSVKND